MTRVLSMLPSSSITVISIALAVAGVVVFFRATSSRYRISVKGKDIHVCLEPTAPPSQPELPSDKSS